MQINDQINCRLQTLNTALITKLRLFWSFCKSTIHWLLVSQLHLLSFTKYIHFGKNPICKFFYVLSSVSFVALVRLKEYIVSYWNHFKPFSVPAIFVHFSLDKNINSLSWPYFPQSHLSDYYFSNNLGSPNSQHFGLFTWSLWFIQHWVWFSASTCYKHHQK